MSQSLTKALALFLGALVAFFSTVSVLSVKETGTGTVSVTDAVPGAENEPASGADPGPAHTPAGVPEPSEAFGTRQALWNRLTDFFQCWSFHDMKGAVLLCMPEWTDGFEEPQNTLFALLLNRTPLDLVEENAELSDDETACTVTVTSLMDLCNGKNPVRYRYVVRMVRETDGEWYVDPESMRDSEFLSEEPFPTKPAE